jgi:hypothetical protein
MLDRRYFARIAIILAMLLVWTQQLVAAHGVVHPWHDGGSSKQAPGSHTQLCDLCVVSALDGMPGLLFLAPVFAPVRAIYVASIVAGVSFAQPRRYLSRAPPVFA